jgi:hypothetical protein
MTTDLAQPMDRVYTTEELLTILAQERQACLRGERLDIKAARTGHPVYDRFFSSEGIQKYAAFDGFRASIHAYQREHDVSGLIWQVLELGDRPIQFPEVHPDLVALDADLVLLRQWRDPILEFWSEGTDGLTLYQSLHKGKTFVPISSLDVARLGLRSEWASLRKSERGEFLEVVLQLSWGRPEQAGTWRHWPQSGSEFIHAVRPGQQPIG